MELSRRRFVQFLSAAPIALAFDPHRKIFDMGRNEIWMPPPVEIVSMIPGRMLELGPWIDESIAGVLAGYGVQMEQTYYGDSDQRIVLAANRKSSLQI